MNFNYLFSVPFRRGNIGEETSILSSLREKASKLSGVIDFGVSTPQNVSIPIKYLNQILKEVSLDNNHILYKYASPSGLPILRENISRQFPNLKISPDNLIIIDGAQHGFFLVATVLLNKNDLVICEQFTYPGFFHNTYLREAKIQTIPILPKKGIDIEYLEKKLKEFKRENKKVKIFWLQPGCHNPWGYSLRVRERIYILNLAYKYNFLIVEDCAYWYFEKNLPTLFELETKYYGNKGNHVIHINPFSKNLGPGLRKGFIAVRDKILRNRLLNCRQMTSKHPTVITDYLVAKMLAPENKEFNFQKWTDTLAQKYNQKRDLALKSIAEYSDLFIMEIIPKQGLFFFPQVKVKNYDQFIDNCLKEKVLVAPDLTFTPHKEEIESDKRHIRISITAPKMELIKEGIKRLAKAAV